MQKEKIKMIEDMIEAGNFHGAAKQLSVPSSHVILDGANNKTFDYLQLKTFNRLQWLVEARPIAERLAGYGELDSNENLEVALCYMLCAQLSEAEHFMKSALVLSKNSVLLASELAILFEQQGKREKAQAIYDKILTNMIQHKKMDAVGARVLNRLAGLRKLDKSEIKRISAMAKKHVGDDLEIRLLFGLANCYARLGDTDNEVKYLVKANYLSDKINEIQPQAQTIEDSRKRLKAIQLLFDKAEPMWMPEYESSKRSPIFVLGMPRSGTTLLEQIIGAHSCVGNSGESRAMGIAFQRQLVGKSLLQEDEGIFLPFYRYKALTREDSKAIIAYYDKYQSLLSKDKIITDKELSNIDRVGLILKFYPNAKFIIIKRHPLDVCVSIMQHDFTQAYFSASSLKIVQEYETYYDKASHWKKLYPESVVEIEYELLVSEFEQCARVLMEFLNLPWEENIKLFHQRENSVRTPSLSQVRSGVNASSVNKWRGYSELIQPAERYLVSRGLISQSF